MKGNPRYLKFWGQTDPAGAKKADFQSMFACSASSVTPSENSSINTNRNTKLTLKDALSNKPKMNIVRCP